MYCCIRRADGLRCTALHSDGHAAAVQAPALGLLLGDPAKVAELQDVMRRLQYDKAEELTYEQLSEGLQWLGKSPRRTAGAGLDWIRLDRVCVESNRTRACTHARERG